MLKRRIYTVSKSREGGWEATESGRGVVATGDRNAEVVRATAKLARKQDSASLRIQRADGRIQEERTYPRGSDPRGSKKLDGLKTGHEVPSPTVGGSQ
jgi:hypothetical protein